MTAAGLDFGSFFKRQKTLSPMPANAAPLLKESVAALGTQTTRRCPAAGSTNGGFWSTRISKLFVIEGDQSLRIGLAEFDNRQDVLAHRRN